ncbi:MAG: cation-translocating P-type ATPase [Verrucomicrobiota bacterium]
MISKQVHSGSKGSVVCGAPDANCDDLDDKLSYSWLRIAIAGVFAGQGMVFSLAVNMTPPTYGSLPYLILHAGLIFSSLIVMIFLGLPLFRSTVGMFQARRLSIEGLFTLSLLGAFFGSLYSSFSGLGSVYYEVVAVVIAIYTFGRMLSERSQAKLLLESQRLRERYDRALVVDESGLSVQMPLSEVTVGSRVRVEPGAPFTVDGVVLNGVGYVSETALSGEPLPCVRRTGERVRAGSWSIDGVFEVEVRAGEGSRELDAILNTVEEVSGRPSAIQNQADELMQGFLPFVAGVSVATAIYWAFMGTWSEAVLNSMAVLLVACPCALGLATPVAIWQGLFRLGQMGLVSRDGALIDTLARGQTIFFDKTGTLSESEMGVAELLVSKKWQPERDELLGAIYGIETRLQHPVARTICKYLDPVAKHIQTDSMRVIPGQGVEASVGGKCVFIGEASLGGLEQKDADRLVVDAGLVLREGKRVFVFIERELAAVFVLRERARPKVAETLNALNALGFETIVLTGDPNPQLEIPESTTIEYGLSAKNKEERVRAAFDEGRLPLFVGDGINDASAMQHAAASISMGSGTDLNRSAASAHLVQDAIHFLPKAVRLARTIYKRLRLNLMYAACYNLLGMLLAACGFLHPLFAAVLMLCSSFFVTARAIRAVPSD